jgi:hypothetical protein
MFSGGMKDPIIVIKLGEFYSNPADLAAALEHDDFRALRIAGDDGEEQAQKNATASNSGSKPDAGIERWKIHAAVEVTRR